MNPVVVTGAPEDLAIGILTAPRPVPTVDACVRELRRAGFHQTIHVSSEPSTRVEPQPGLAIRVNPSRLGLWRNWFACAGRLLTETNAPWLLICEDDLRLSPDAALALQHAFRTLPRDDWGFASLYTPRHNILRTEPTRGWQSVELRGAAWGALGWCFRRESLEAVLHHPEVLFHPRDDGTDTLVSRTCSRLGLRTWFHVPSLGAHMGAENSSVGHRTMAGMEPVEFDPDDIRYVADHEFAPPVTCILAPTSDSGPLVARSVQQFLEQDHPHKELLVVAGSHEFSHFLPESEQIRFIDGPRGASRAELVRDACRHARSSLVADWSEWRWHDPRRLSAQVDQIGREGADGVVTRHTGELLAATGGMRSFSGDGAGANAASDTCWMARKEFASRLIEELSIRQGGAARRATGLPRIVEGATCELCVRIRFPDEDGAGQVDTPAQAPPVVVPAADRQFYRWIARGGAHLPGARPTTETVPEIGIRGRKRPWRVLWLLADLAQGGITTYTANLFRSIPEEDVEPVAVVFHHWTEKHTDFPAARMLRRRARIVCTDHRPIPEAIRRRYPEIEFRPGPGIYDELIDQCDVVTSASTNPHVLSRHDWRGKPLLVQLHSTCEQTRAIARTLLPHAAHIVVTSQEAFDAATGRFGMPAGRISIVEGAVDAHRIASWRDPSELRAELLRRGRHRIDRQVAEAAHWALYFGRFSPEKRIPLIADAVRALNGRGQSWVGVFVGGGWDVETTYRQIRKLIPTRSLLIPWVENVGDVLRASDAFLCASEYEGGPMTSLEALLSGIPVLSTDVGILPALRLRSPEGQDIPACRSLGRDPNAESIADEMLRAVGDRRPMERRVSDAWLAMQAAGRFSARRLAEDWTRILGSLTTRAQP